MKRLKYLLSAELLLFIMAGVPVYIAASQQNEENTDEAKQVDIMFTHDTHSHLDSFLTQENGENVMVGGFARIKTLIDEKKAENADAFLFDAGDFSMGTLVQTIFMEEAAELRMLGALGCDVTTFGNHEFDYRSQGLAKMLKSAAANTDRVPAIALCNVDWERMEKDGLTDEQQMLKEAFVGEQVVLIENEFGEIGIDGGFLKDAGIEISEMSSGCICCSLQTDLMEQLRSIMASERFDYIVIEASGICEPEPIARTVCSFPAMGPEMCAHGIPRIDAIVTVVDALRLADEFDGGSALTAANVADNDPEPLVANQIQSCKEDKNKYIYSQHC